MVFGMRKQSSQNKGAVFVRRKSIVSWCLVTSLSFNFTPLASLFFSFTYTQEENESSKGTFVYLSKQRQTCLIIHHFGLWEDSQRWLQSPIHLQCNTAAVELHSLWAKLKYTQWTLPKEPLKLVYILIPANTAVTIVRVPLDLQITHSCCCSQKYWQNNTIFFWCLRLFCYFIWCKPTPRTSYFLLYS